MLTIKQLLKAADKEYDVVLSEIRNSALLGLSEIKSTAPHILSEIILTPQIFSPSDQ